MSTDTVLHAVTTIQRRFMLSDLFGPDPKRALLLSTDVMRHHLKAEDAPAFNAYVDQGLARSPDRFDLILTELFAELQISDRDQLTAILAQE